MCAFQGCAELLCWRSPNLCRANIWGGRCIMILPSGVVTLHIPRICGNCSTSTAKQFEDQEEEEKGTSGVSGAAST